MEPSAPLFGIHPEVETIIRDANPWWRGDRDAGLPPLRRWAFDPVLRGLRGGLAPAVVLRGPRQIGKTTLLRQIIDHLLSEGLPPRHVFRVQFDDLPSLRRLGEQPILALCRWYADHILGMSFQQAAGQGARVTIFLDEVQNLRDWPPQLKYLVDMQPVRVLVAGSSALRIEAGRDSLAGRVQTVEMGPLLLREIAEMRGLGRLGPVLPANGLAPCATSASGGSCARAAGATQRRGTEPSRHSLSAVPIRWRRRTPRSRGNASPTSSTRR